MTKTIYAPDQYYHIYNRGVNRQPIFYTQHNWTFSLQRLNEYFTRDKAIIIAYCLMPNHVHMIAVPESADGLRRAIGEAHRRYTRQINFREGWRGHLWQGRFASFVMDEPYLLATARYVELNPVRAGLVSAPSEYPWSSARAHLTGRDDALVQVAPLLELAPDWRRLLTSAVREEELKVLRGHERTGRPLGDDDFLVHLEKNLGRVLRHQKPGRKRNLRQK